MRKRMGIIGYLVAAAVLSGCGSLYDAGKDRAAQAAGKAVDDAGLGRALDAERSALAQQQAERRALAERAQLALRDRALVGLLDGKTAQASWGALARQVGERSAEIAGSAGPELDPARCPLLPPPRSDDALAARVTLADLHLRQEADKVKIARSQLALLLAAHPSPPALGCGQPLVLPAALQGGDAGMLADAYRGACARLAQAEQCAASAFAGGRLHMLRHTLLELGKAGAQIDAEIAARRAAYRQVLQAADSGAAPGGPDELAARLRTALQALGNTSASAAKVAEPMRTLLSESGRLAALEEKRALLDGYLQALAGAEAPHASKRQHRVLLVSSLLSQRSASPAPTAGILMEAEFTRQQIGAAEARLQRARQAEQIYRRQQEQLLAELGLLLEARAHLSATPARCKARPLHASLASGAAPVCAQGAAKALAAFASAWTLGRNALEQDDYRLVDLREQGALEESATALAQSDAVLKTVVGQIAALHASGIKPQDIAALVQALSLPAIAAGVR